MFDVLECLRALALGGVVLRKSSEIGLEVAMAKS